MVNCRSMLQKQNRIAVFIFSQIWDCDRRYIIFRFGMAILTGLYPVVNVVYPKLIIDAITARHSIIDIATVVGAFFVIQIIYFAITSIWNIYDGICSNKIVCSINEKIMRKMMNLDLSFFDSPDMYDAFQKARNEAGTRAKSTFECIVLLFSSSISLFSLGALFTNTDPILLLVVILTMLISAILNSRTKRVVFEYNKGNVPINRYLGYLYNVMTSKMYAKDVRVFHIEEWLVGKYLKNFYTILKRYKNNQRELLRINGANGILLRVQNAFLYLYLAKKALYQMISVGDFTMLIMTVQNLNSAITAIVSNLLTVYENSMYTANLMQFFNLENKIVSGNVMPPPLCQTSPSPILRVCNVSFSYPNSTSRAISNISIEVFRGEKILIVGENGSGKTTIIKLLLRLYEPSSGSIIYSGKDISEYDLHSYRDEYSVIFQDYNTYAFSVAENIFMREFRQADTDTLDEVIESSGLKDRISSLADGANTVLSREFDKYGAEFSIGEMQKISLARAIARKAKIIILDEPTSSLDPAAESNVYLQYMKMCEGKTSIFISHRLSCAMYMDRIVYIKKGEVVECGTHKELIELQGEYAKMFELQACNYK